MKTQTQMRKSTATILSVCLAAWLAGCAQSSAPANNNAQPMASANPSNPPSASPVNAGAPMQAVQPPSGLATNGQFEQPPVISATDLLPVSALSGPGFYVQTQVPTNGAMGQYTIVADPSVFHNDAGTYQIESLDMLKIRLSEIPAIAQLDNMSQTGLFAKEVATSAARPVEAAAQMVGSSPLPPTAASLVTRCRPWRPTASSTASTPSRNKFLAGAPSQFLLDALYSAPLQKGDP